MPTTTLKPVDLRRDRNDRAVAFALTVVSLAALFSAIASSTTAEADPADSPVYWATWLVFPVIAFFVATYRPLRRGPLTWALALTGPWMLAALITGTLGHNPDDGASLWIASELLLAIEAVWIVGISSLGHLLARRTEPSALA